MATLRFDLFEDFKGAPKMLLLWGDQSGLAEFGKLLRQFGESQCRTAALHAEEWAKGALNLELTLEAVASSSEVVLKQSSGSATSVLWRELREDFDRYGDLVSALLAAPEGRGHQYLASGRRGDIEVMISTGEYPDELPTH